MNRSPSDGLGTVDVADADPTKPPQKVPVKPAPITDAGIKSVVVRSLATIADPRLLADDDIVLHRSGIDLNRIHPAADPGGDSESLLLNAQGQVLYASKHAIALKSAYFNPEVASTRDRMGFSASTDAKVLQGFPGVRVTNPLDPRTTVTNDKGGYQARYFLVPCPCFPRMDDSLLTYEVPYKNFNPKNRNPLATYTVMRQTYETCIPDNAAMCFAGGGLMGLLVGLNVQAIYATMATPAQTRLDIRLSSFLLTGTGTLANGAGAPVELGAATTWDDAPSAQTPAKFDFDFDGDGIVDAAEDGTLGDQAGQRFIWLGGKTPTPDPETHRWIGYDLQREADSRIDLVPHGRLKTITREDLAQTDLYIFRDSTGELITERIGLNPQETSATDQGAIDEEGDTPAFYYKALMRGPYFNETGRTNGSLAQWHTQADIKLDYYGGNQIDALQPGELVTLVAINRPTGYVGRATVPLHYRGDATQATGLDVPLPELVLGPPQLRIHAERQTAVAAGLTQGDPRTTRIGSEGAGLTTDTYISLSTEWTDATGQPLPAELSGYGYSGTLAKITGPNQLSQDQGCGSALSTLDIGPGLKHQLIKLSGGCGLANEHYYLYVCGWPAERPERSRCFDFQNGRPKARVPVQVALYDEDATQKLLLAEHRNENAGTDANPKTDTLPRYVWVTRPEFEFSVFDFKPTAVNMTDRDGNTTNILNDATPVIASSDQLLGILYSLSAPGGGNPLDLLDPTYSADAQATRGLILALGDTEIPVTLQNGVLREAACPDALSTPPTSGALFCNLGALARLDASDYLTLRLYANGDSANVLWEWAFASQLQPVLEENALTADTARVIVGVATSGPPEDSTNNSPPLVVDWTVQGPNAALGENSTSTYDGIAVTTLYTSQHAGDTYTVTGRVRYSRYPGIWAGQEIKIGPVEVAAGVPKTAELSATTTDVPADGISEVGFTTRILDAWGNPVSDGTAVAWAIDGGGDATVPGTGVLTSDQPSATVTLTTRGQAEFHYQVGVDADSTRVSLSSGAAVAQQTITKKALELTLTPSAATIPVDQTASVTVTASVRDSSGAPIRDGVPVEWMLPFGKVVRQSEATANGQATLEFLPPDAPADGEVVAAVAGVSKAVPIRYAPPSQGLSAELEYAAIVGAAADGSVQVETRDGYASHAYVTSTAVTIHGAPGDGVTLSPGGLYTPNAAASGWFAMNALDQDSSGRSVITDSVSGAIGYVNGAVSHDPNHSYLAGGSSLSIDGGYVSIPKAPGLAVADGFYLNLRFRLDDIQSYSGEPEAELASRDGSFGLFVVEDPSGRHIQARITTDAGEVRLDSPALIEKGQWTIAGLRIQGGQLELGVGDQRTQVALGGALEDSAAAVNLGRGLRGWLDDLQYGTETPDKALVRFADGSMSTTVHLDGSGQAQVRLQATGVAPGAGATVGLSYQSVGVAANDAPRREIAITNTLGRLALSALGIGEAHALGVPVNRTAFAGSGVAVTTDEAWGAVAEWVGRTLTDPATWDKIKATASFVADLTGVGDIKVLLKAILAMIRGEKTDVTNVDIVFAAIGVALTITTVVTTGGTALGPMRIGLSSLKTLFREFFTNDIKAIIGLVRATVEFVFKQVRLFLTNPKEALAELKRFGAAVPELLNSANLALQTIFVRSVRSLDDLKNFIRYILGGANCAVQFTYRKPSSPWENPAATMLAFAADGVWGEQAHAAQLYTCHLHTELDPILDEIAKDARFGAKAAELSKKVLHQVTELRAAGIDVSPDSARRLSLLASIDDGESVNRLIELIKKPGGDFKYLAEAMPFSPELYVNGVKQADLAMSNFDHFIETVMKVPLPDPSDLKAVENYKAFMARMGGGTDGNPNMLRAMYGEAQAVSCIHGHLEDCISAGLPPTVIEKFSAVDPATLKLDDRVRYNEQNGVQGVDAVWKRFGKAEPDVFLESKIRGGKNVKIVGKGTETLQGQFRKHLDTKVRQLSTTAIDPLTGKRVRTWNNGEPPLLIYDMRGGAFKGKEADVRKAFEDVLKEFEPPLKDFDIEKSNIILLFDSEKATYPWINIQES